MTTNALALATIDTFRNRVFEGDALTLCNSLPSNSVDCCVTSPPYYGLRDYGVEGQIGLEDTPEQYIQHLVALFREVRRVLKPTGTCWINLGDSFAGGKGQSGSQGAEHQEARNKNQRSLNKGYQTLGGKKATKPTDSRAMLRAEGLKPKDLIGIPWRVALALQADGWYLRSDIIWHKPNCMPESVTDRPTKAHEYVFLLSKSQSYYYDADAIREPLAYPDETRRPLGSKGAWQMDGREQGDNGGGKPYDGYPTGRNKRSVWTIPTQSYTEAHFATFPEALPETCIKAGCPVTVCAVCGKPHVRGVEKEERITAGRREQRDYPGSQGQRSGTVPGSNTRGFPQYKDVLIGFAPTCNCNGATEPGITLDPFFGAGTTGVMAKRLERDYIGAELNPDYAALARKRIADDNPFQDHELAPGIVQQSLFALN